MEQKIINYIKNHLLELYACDTWQEFVNCQSVGDCQNICYDIMGFKLKGIVHVFGMFELDDEIYDIENDEYSNQITHHWIEYNGQILDFSKGTLPDISLDEIYEIEIIDDSRYHKLYEK